MKLKNIIQGLVIVVLLIAAVYSLLPDKPKHNQRLSIDDGGIIYQGSMFKQKFNGQGTVKFKNDDTYVGHFTNGQFNGQGRFISHNHWEFKGQFKKNLPHGQGVLKMNKQSYQATFKKGELINAH
ncbi:MULTISPECIES: hypothetical protein [Weissella]|uniref:MORN motif family protein n=2 Tax=Weissella TaxID=46255 RepID=A0A1L6RB56_9LACO|nr:MULTISPECIES: hypothetical protein [Weissella]APS41712.1 MORN motif family protein [Weissella jogaejeotgali]NKY90544.1 hypothetical protein [Weissella thailandensis]RDS60105.1 hypothetical protein DWV05_02330 [Weissella thailandensis]GEP73802.1 hypothetical protein WTH01_00490 [Weissella thailandensis]